MLTSLVVFEHLFQQLDTKILQSVGEERAHGIADDRR